MSIERERELVIKLKTTRNNKARLKAELELAQEELDQAEQSLYELMEAEEKQRTATYEGVGFVSILSPKVRASCKKENQSLLFDFLKGIDRADLIKQEVDPRSLSTFVGELIKEGGKLPEFVTYYLQPQIKFYEEK